MKWNEIRLDKKLKYSVSYHPLYYRLNTQFLDVTSRKQRVS